jgi:hypothetical protein
MKRPVCKAVLPKRFDCGSFLTLKNNYGFSQPYSRKDRESEWQVFKIKNLYEGKAIPVQAWTGPEGFRMLRLPEFLRGRHTKVEGCQPQFWPPLLPLPLLQSLVMVFISVTGWVDRRAIVQPKGLCQWHIRERNPRPFVLQCNTSTNCTTAWSKTLYLRTYFRQPRTHASSIRNNALHDLPSINPHPAKVEIMLIS